MDEVTRHCVEKALNPLGFLLSEERWEIQIFSIHDIGILSFEPTSGCAVKR